MVRIKDLKGKFPEKKDPEGADTCIVKEAIMYNQGQDSYAVLEVECDYIELKKVLIKADLSFHNNPNSLNDLNDYCGHVAEEIAASLKEILVIGGGK